MAQCWPGSSSHVTLVRTGPKRAHIGSDGSAAPLRKNGRKAASRSDTRASGSLVAAPGIGASCGHLLAWDDESPADFAAEGRLGAKRGGFAERANRGSIPVLRHAMVVEHGAQCDAGTRPTRAAAPQRRLVSKSWLTCLSWVHASRGRTEEVNRPVGSLNEEPSESMQWELKPVRVVQLHGCASRRIVARALDLCALRTPTRPCTPNVYSGRARKPRIISDG